MAGTHYDVLGVSGEASAPEVRRAYILLARRHHPDLNQGPHQVAAEAAMQSVNEAWHVLGDPDRRRDYDQTLLFEESEKRRDAAAAGAADPEWRPFDPTDAPERDFDPRPIKGSNDVPRFVTLAPACLLVFALVIGAVGLLVSSNDVIALAAVLGVFAIAGFILMPLIVMSRAERDPKL